jgi:RNA polymerase sigma-70 factor, ECF subfamily
VAVTVSPFSAPTTLALDAAPRKAEACDVQAYPTATTLAIDPQMHIRSIPTRPGPLDASERGGGHRAPKDSLSQSTIERCLPNVSRDAIAPKGAPEPREEARTPVDDFERLFRAHQDRIGRFLVQMLRDRALAEDLLQETFLAAFRARDQLPQVQSEEAWLYGIARHRALRYLRGWRRGLVALDRVVSGLRLARTETPDPSVVASVRDVLQRTLKPDDRALVLLYYLHGFTAAELAGMTGTSHVAVRQRLSRARRTLAEQLGDWPRPADVPQAKGVTDSHAGHAHNG